MALNPNIILSGGPGIDFVGSMDRGQTAAQDQINRQNQNAFTAANRQYGAAALRGDQNALNALAGYSPEMAQGLQSGQLGMDNTRLQMQQTQQNMAFGAEEMQMARDEARRAVGQAASQMTADQRAAELASGEKVLAGLTQATSPQQWDAFAQQSGQPELMGQWDNRQILFAQVEGAREALRAMQVEAPKPMSPEGKFAADQAAGFVLPGAQQLPTGTTVNVGGDGSTRPGQVFDAMTASAEAARAAANGLRSMREASAALQGGAITGFGADARLSAAKLGALMGVTDPAIIENTETFRSTIAPQVAAMLKATVGSAQISNSDREFAEKAAGGSISLDSATIQRLLGIMEKAAIIAIDGHNTRLNAVYPEGAGADRERALFGVSIPDATTPNLGENSSLQPALSPEAQAVFDKYSAP